MWGAPWGALVPIGSPARCRTFPAPRRFPRATRWIRRTPCLSAVAAILAAAAAFLVPLLTFGRRPRLSIERDEDGIHSRCRGWRPAVRSARRCETRHVGAPRTVHGCSLIGIRRMRPAPHHRSRWGVPSWDGQAHRMPLRGRESRFSRARADPSTSDRCSQYGGTHPMSPCATTGSQRIRSSWELSLELSHRARERPRHRRPQGVACSVRPRLLHSVGRGRG